MGIKHEIHHGLDLPLARKALDKAMEAYSARFSDFNPFFDWKSDTQAKLGFSAKGVKVQGDMEIKGDKILVDLDVPFLLRVFKGKAMEVIDTEVKEWVQRAKNGELD